MQTISEIVSALNDYDATEGTDIYGDLILHAGWYDQVATDSLVPAGAGDDVIITRDRQVIMCMRGRWDAISDPETWIRRSVLDVLNATDDGTDPEPWEQVKWWIDWEASDADSRFMISVAGDVIRFCERHDRWEETDLKVAHLDAVSGRLWIETDGEDTDLVHIGGLVLPTECGLEPWGEDETDLTRADDALADGGWRRVGFWDDSRAENNTCLVEPTGEQPRWLAAP